MHRCTTHALYWFKLWQQGHCQHPQNANPDRSTLEGTAQRIGRPFGGGGAKPKAEDTTRKTRTKEFIEKVQAIIDETPQRPIQQIARDLGVSHTTVNACVKEDCICRSYRRQTSQILTEKTKNLRLIKSVRLLTWTRWTTSLGHTSRTSPTWPSTTPTPAWSLPSAEYLLSPC